MKLGDIADAKETASRIENKLMKSEACSRIAMAQADAGDIAGARVTMKGIGTAYHRADAKQSIAKARVRAANGTKNKPAEQISIRERASIYREIAEYQAGIKDTVGAKATVARLREMLSQMSKGDEKASGVRSKSEGLSKAEEKAVLYGIIAEAQSLAGDIDGAKATITQSGDKSRRDCSLGEIAATQARAGDIAGAKITAEQIGDEHEKADTYGAIALAQAEAGDVPAAESMIAKHRAGSDNSSLYRWIAKAQLKANDLNGAKASAAHVRAEDARQEILQEIAAGQAKAGDVAGAKATQSQTNKEFGHPQSGKLIVIFIVLVPLVLGTTAMVLAMIGSRRRTSQGLATLSLFLTMPEGFISIVPMPFFALVLDGMIGGRGFGVVSENYWQSRQCFYLPFIVLAGIAIAFGVAWLARRCAARLGTRLAPAATWFLSFGIFLFSAIFFQALMFLILISLQAMGLRDSCLWNFL